MYDKEADISGLDREAFLAWLRAGGGEMKQYTETEHVLQMRDDVGTPRESTWRTVIAGMHMEDLELTASGLIQQALRKARDTHIEHYGNMHGVEFRVVTTTRTVTVLGGEINEGVIAK